jgi:hypothetical protein
MNSSNENSTTFKNFETPPLDSYTNFYLEPA